MAQALDNDAIAKLLGRQTKQAPPSTPKIIRKHEKLKDLVHLGPMMSTHPLGLCAYNDHGLSTHTKIDGEYYCEFHALLLLNKMILESRGYKFSDCTCTIGKYTQFNCHTEDCPIMYGEEVTSGVSSDG